MLYSTLGVPDANLMRLQKQYLGKVDSLVTPLRGVNYVGTSAEAVDLLEKFGVV